MDVEGRRVLVTGASRSIGLNLARGFAAAGADVVVVARNADLLADVAKEIGGRAYPADLTDRDTLRTLIGQIEQDGPIDVLVNNAGDGSIGWFAETEPGDLEMAVDLNVLAPAALTRQVLPGMLERGRGHIVNISSLAGVLLPPGLATYAATKAFINHHSANLRFELRNTPVGITKVEVAEVADTGLMDRGRDEPALSGMFDLMYRLRMSRLVQADEITAASIRAVRENRASVRLPRRLAPHSWLVDAPRAMAWAASRQFNAAPRPVVTEDAS